VRKQRPQQKNLDHYAEVEDQVGEESDAAHLDQHHFKSQLQVAIKSLEDPFRSIMIMRDIQGMSYEEIQGSLELSASQVKVYLHRARRKLRENSKLRQLFEEQIADRSEVNQAIALVANNDKGNGYAQ
jgi:RNA polymerase sigma-70 factor (ECF subfamily)